MLYKQTTKLSAKYIHIYYVLFSSWNRRRLSLVILKMRRKKKVSWRYLNSLDYMTTTDQYKKKEHHRERESTEKHKCLSKQVHVLTTQKTHRALCFRFLIVYFRWEKKTENSIFGIYKTDLCSDVTAEGKIILRIWYRIRAR